MNVFQPHRLYTRFSSLTAKVGRLLFVLAVVPMQRRQPHARGIKARYAAADAERSQ